MGVMGRIIVLFRRERRLNVLLLLLWLILGC